MQRLPVRRPTATLPTVAKTLVIAEKPSVGRDLARVLPGPFAKHEGWLEAENYVLTWAVGHLVQLLDEHRTNRAQSVHHIFVVYHFVTHIDRRAEQIDGALHDVDGAINAGAKTARIG